MWGFLANIVLSAAISVASAWGLYHYAPLSILESGQPATAFGTTVTTINGSDTLSGSRTTINNNFAALNTGKFELSDWYATTSAAQLTTLAGLTTASALSSIGTITSGTWHGSTIGIGFGGTNATTLGAHMLLAFNNTSIVATSTPTAGAYIATSTTATTTFAGAFQVGSTPSFQVTAGGETAICEGVPATSTTMTLDWQNTCPQVTYQMGTAAFTITMINATTSSMAGSRKMVVICNPNASAGAVTWKGPEWYGGTLPTQTTTANQCDAWSFHVTIATSTSAYKVFGALSSGAQ